MALPWIRPPPRMPPNPPGPPARQPPGPPPPAPPPRHRQPPKPALLAPATEPAFAAASESVGPALAELTAATAASAKQQRVVRLSLDAGGGNRLGRRIGRKSRRQLQLGAQGRRRVIIEDAAADCSPVALVTTSSCWKPPRPRREGPARALPPALSLSKGPDLAVRRRAVGVAGAVAGAAARCGRSRSERPASGRRGCAVAGR